MGTFSSGSEGEGYKEAHCWKCEHWGRDNKSFPGCPIWDIHFEHGYGPKGDVRRILNHLIPVDEKLGNQRCKMWTAKVTT